MNQKLTAALQHLATYARNAAGVFGPLVTQDDRLSIEMCLHTNFYVEKANGSPPADEPDT